MVRDWVRNLGPDDLLFPRIERKKTWYMVRKDLERIGIPSETPDGIADFHAAGRHSQITGLVRSGASIMEAKELARHADIRQTAKYTHIGMEDRAEALGNLPSPDASAHVDLLRIVCISGGALGRQESPVVSEADPNDRFGNEQTPAGPGLVSSSVVNCHQKAVYIEVEAAGIAPASRDPSVAASTCVVDPLIVGLTTPIDRVRFGLSRHFFDPRRNRRLGEDEPTVSTPATVRRHSRDSTHRLRYLGSETEANVVVGN